MKIYFLSSLPCILTVNETYFGLCNRFERFAELSLKDNLFLRFLPENRAPVSFFLTEKILTDPPENCEVYLLKDAIAIYATHFPPTDFSLRPHAQFRDGTTLATLFSQGELHLSINTPEGLFTATLPPSFEDATLSFHQNLCFVEGKNRLAIYTKTAKCVFMEEILDFSVENATLNATLPLSDSLNRTAKCQWSLSEDACVQTQCVLSQPAFTNTLSEGLLSYAFFESVLLGGDYSSLLCESLRPHAEKIKTYLGNFLSVSFTEDPNVCVLLYEKSPRLFKAEYYTVDVEDDKIKNVRQNLPEKTSKL